MKRGPRRVSRRYPAEDPKAGDAVQKPGLPERTVVMCFTQGADVYVRYRTALHDPGQWTDCKLRAWTRWCQDAICIRRGP